MPAILFSNAALLDPVADELLEDHHVLVEDGLVKEVSDRPLASRSARRIDLAGRTLMPGLIDLHVHVLATQVGTVIFRRFYLPFDAAEAARQIEEHVARDPDPEVVGPVVIRSPADLPEGILPHMLPLIEWHFADGATGRAGAVAPA